MLLPATDTSYALSHVWTPHVALVYSVFHCYIQSVILAVVNSWSSFLLLLKFGTSVTRSCVKEAYGIPVTEEGFLVEV